MSVFEAISKQNNPFKSSNTRDIFHHHPQQEQEQKEQSISNDEGLDTTQYSVVSWAIDKIQPPAPFGQTYFPNSDNEQECDTDVFIGHTLAKLPPRHTRVKEIHGCSSTYQRSLPVSIKDEEGQGTNIPNKTIPIEENNNNNTCENENENENIHDSCKTSANEDEASIDTDRVQVIKALDDDDDNKNKNKNNNTSLDKVPKETTHSAVMGGFELLMTSATTTVHINEENNDVVFNTPSKHSPAYSSSKIVNYGGIKRRVISDIMSSTTSPQSSTDINSSSNNNNSNNNLYGDDEEKEIISGPHNECDCRKINKDIQSKNSPLSMYHNNIERDCHKMDNKLEVLKSQMIETTSTLISNAVNITELKLIENMEEKLKTALKNETNKLTDQFETRIAAVKDQYEMTITNMKDQFQVLINKYIDQYHIANHATVKNIWDHTQDVVCVDIKAMTSLQISSKLLSIDKCNVTSCIFTLDLFTYDVSSHAGEIFHSSSKLLYTPHSDHKLTWRSITGGSIGTKGTKESGMLTSSQKKYRLEIKLEPTTINNNVECKDNNVNNNIHIESINLILIAHSDVDSNWNIKISREYINNKVNNATE